MGSNSYSHEINFYKPEKRFIIPIDTFHIPKKLFNEFKKDKFKFKINHSFKEIIENCSKPRKSKDETWINDIIKNSYIELFNEGYAKSIECYYKNKLIGGLYGIHIGGVFFGESMFSNVNNASKLCLLFLISILEENKFKLLDSQFYNPHLIQFGAYEVSNLEYELKLNVNIKKNCKFPKHFSFQKSLAILHSISHKS